MFLPCAAVTTALVMAKNPLVLAILATDGFIALAVIIAATLGGLALLPAFRLGRLSLPQQLLYGAGLGLGLIALLVVLLGWAGVLHRPVWIAILAVLCIAGVLRLRKTYRRQERPPEPRASARADAAPVEILVAAGVPAGRTPHGAVKKRPAGTQAATKRRSVDGISTACSARAEAAQGDRLRLLWLLICPFLALTVLVACVPPGYLWAEEGNGYDVLEYHLEMPKEYLQAGRVQYAPHNVYANFPANVEMLYLLCMILRGDAIQAAVACKLLNAGLAVLTVAAAWMVGRRRGPGTATVTAVIAAGVGWLIYLSGVAFVENGMLLFGMLSVSALNDGLDQSASRRRWYTLAGLLAGFSLGCKYTAGALIGLPLTVALLFCSQMPLRRRLIGAGLFAAAQAVAFMPWAAKNTAMTGNPVFPLANSVFAAHPPGWGPAESSHFDASHAAASNERSLGARLAALWRHIPADPDQRFGAVLLVFAAWAALTLRRDDTIRLCGVILLIQLPIWLFTTHLYARFAVPLLIPLILMAGRVPLAGTRRKGAIVGMLIIGTAINLAFFAALYLRHMAPQGQRFAIEGVPEYFTEGAAAGFEYLEVVNKDLPTDARILLIGDAKAFYFRRQVDYCVVFNRSPFVQQVRAGATPAAILQWLADRGYTHVLVNWAEIRRLARSAYGFPEEITPDLFGRLTTAGLETVCTVDSHTTGRPYADLYRVAAPPG